MPDTKKRDRPDHDGKHRLAFERNKRRILASETICGICGQPVDKSLKYPDPMCATIDHIIPIDRGGHPSDISNLQLAHFWCNRQKSNKIGAKPVKDDKTGNESTIKCAFPLSRDWSAYRPADEQGA